MTEVPASLPLERTEKSGAATLPPHPMPASVWVSESAKPVEIVVNDQYCTKILLDCAAPLFPAEIVSGSSWVVRLRPPAGGRWVPELLSLVERWLEAARLPCAKVLYDGRSYLIRTSPDITQSSTLTDITSVTMVSGSTLLN